MFRNILNMRTAQQKLLVGLVSEDSVDFASVLPLYGTAVRGGGATGMVRMPLRRQECPLRRQNCLLHN